MRLKVNWDKSCGEMASAIANIKSGQVSIFDLYGKGDKVKGLGKYNICKFQRPLATTRDIPTVLVYNENRSFLKELPRDAGDLDGLFPNDELKTYWECTITRNGELETIKQVEEQPW